MINDVINDPNSAFGDVARVIGYDASLSARLLQIVNSPFYNFPQKVETITHAISIVGTEQLRDLALATTVLTRFDGIPDQWIDMNAFWRHSVGSGIASRVIALQCRQPNAERFFLTGILHDVGRLILLENHPEIIGPLLERCEGVNPLLVELEQQAMGFDHGAVGAALCRAWQLPALLEEVIACHHQPETAATFPLETGILNLGNLITTAMNLGSSGDGRVPSLNESVWKRIGLAVGHLQGIWDQIQTQFNETVEIVLSR